MGPHCQGLRPAGLGAQVANAVATYVRYTIRRCNVTTDQSRGGHCCGQPYSGPREQELWRHKRKPNGRRRKNQLVAQYDPAPIVPERNRRVVSDRRPKHGDVREQTSDALTIVKAALEKAGSSMENVLKVQVALVDPEKNWEPMDQAYNTFFPNNRPARSYFGVTGFRRPGQLLQIDCIAYVD